MLAVEIGPEQIRDDIAAVSLSGYRQVCCERHRFAALNLDRMSLIFDPGKTKQTQPQFIHLRFFLSRSCHGVVALTLYIIHIYPKSDTYIRPTVIAASRYRFSA